MSGNYSRYLTALNSVEAAAKQIDRRLIDLFLDTHVVLTGVGKSYHVAELGASLLQSVGVWATAISATDLLHGSLNILSRGGTLVALSHSGETEEVIGILQAQRKNVVQILITSNEKSTAAWSSDITLDYTCKVDGSKHGTIPAVSTIAQLMWINEIVCTIADMLPVSSLAAGHPDGALAARYERMMKL